MNKELLLARVSVQLRMTVLPVKASQSALNIYTKLGSKKGYITIVLSWHTKKFGLFLQTRLLKTFRQKSDITKSEF